jgi:hypothetical protein
MLGRLAEDYIEDDARAVPAAIKRCGAQFVAFNGRITDGGEAAYFSTDHQSAVECVKRALPQAAVEPAPAVLVGALREKRSASTNGS